MLLPAVKVIFCELKVQPIGDYSTYTLKVIHRDVVLDINNNPVLNGDGNPVLESKIDPLSASLDFKFRPGCFNSNCAPGGRFATAFSRAGH